MSRMSVRTFLVHAKKRLNQLHSINGTTSFVVGNESADLDSISSSIVYAYIQSSTVEARKSNSFTIPVTNIPAADLGLRPELTALLRHAYIQPEELITLDDISRVSPPPETTSWTLVDHNALTGNLAPSFAPQVNSVIDHHDDEKAISPSAQPRIIAKSGSCASLVVNHLRPTWDTISSSSSNIGAALGQTSYHITDDFAFTSTWDGQVAYLALGAILIDTQSLTSEDKVTEHDQQAVKYLEARINASLRLGKGYDRDRLFRELTEAKIDLGDLSVRDCLRKDYKEWTEGDLKLGISSVVKSVAWLEKREGGLVGAMRKWAKERDLAILAVMTAFTDGEGEFARELVVMATENGTVAEAAERFENASSQELQLKDSELKAQRDVDVDVPYLRQWTQGNLAASRKRAIAAVASTAIQLRQIRRLSSDVRHLLAA
ncbi:Exopolyphosphatase [Oleoguttula sp. CCFEE 5521]